MHFGSVSRCLIQLNISSTRKYGLLAWLANYLVSANNLPTHNFIDITGHVYGRLTVLSRGPNDFTNKNTRWNCECECGNIVLVSKTSLNSGDSKSCGCLHSEVTRKINTRHGNSTRIKGMTKEYQTWQGMHQRCANKKDPWYGSRGISVCERWSGKDGFANFLADMGTKPDNMEIDRTDNNKGYSPDNCTWVTKLQNCSNKRTNVYLHIDGITATLSEWSRKLGISKYRVKSLYKSCICSNNNKTLH